MDDEDLGDNAGVRAENDDGKPSRGKTAQRRGRQARRGESARLSGRDGDEDREDGPKEKVEICHKPGTHAEKTLQIPESAVPGHLGHGDELGACDGDVTPTAP